MNANSMIKVQIAVTAACVAMVMSSLCLIASIITTGTEAATPLLNVGVGLAVTAMVVLAVALGTKEIQDRIAKRDQEHSADEAPSSS
ncbi:MAG TPA: hypothetical protein VF867_11585 [Arthrobacter sp.]